MPGRREDVCSGNRRVPDLKIDLEPAKIDFWQAAPRPHLSRYNRLAECFEHQNNAAWPIATTLSIMVVSAAPPAAVSYK
jgi:hypothetical protein